LSITVDILKPGSENAERLFFDAARNVHARTHFGIEKSLWLSAKDIHQEFNKQVLAKNKTGNLYLIRVGRRIKKHTASAAGETPANITGNYRRSFGFVVNQGSDPALVIGNTAEYSGFLELGTRATAKRRRMKPRPGLLNSINASQRDIMRNLTEEILQEA